MNGSQTPQDLRSIEASLESLARAEQSAAPATLEDRIFVATRADLAGIERPLTITVQRRTLARMRIAAGVALAAGVLAVWLAGHGSNGRIGGGTASLEGLENEVEFLLAMRSTDDGLRPPSDSIDSVFLETLNLGNSMKSGAGVPVGEEGSL